MSKSISLRNASGKYRKLVTSKGYREKLSTAVKAGITVEDRLRRSKSALEQWAKPGAREQMVAAVKQSLLDPKERKRRSKHSKKLWTDQQHRQRITEVATVRNSSPEFKEKFTAAIQRGWDGNEERKRKVSEAMRKLWLDPNFRAKASAASAARWCDPKTRAAMTTRRKRKPVSMQ